MTKATIIVDGREIKAEVGSRLLWAIIDAGIWVPNLCAIRGLEPPDGGCRLCWVEVEDRESPVTSCTQPVFDGMVVRTRSPAVDRLVRAGFEMLLSTHRLDCKDCPGNRRCALQEIARLRKIPLRGKRLFKIEPDFPVDESRADLGLNPNHCVLCGKCVHVCNPFDGQPLAEQDCGDCTRCAEVCPVGAIYLRR
jgi:formate dehydrogenase major subunit/NADH-quinone oxidoreductase subunit G